MTINIITSYENGVLLQDVPPIHLFENFITEEDATHLKQLAKEKLQQAFVSGDKAGYESKGRSGKNCWIQHNTSSLTQSIAERVSELVKIPLQHAEPFQIIHYGPNQEYAPHYDGWQHDTDRGERCMKRGGQRLITCLIYLNEVKSGGETLFPKLNLRVPPKPLSMVIFHNCEHGTNQRHEDSLHGGCPVIEGEKWACNLWFREHSYR